SAPSSISTKPKPRERPVSRSVITCTRETVPNCAKASRRSSEVVLNGRFPTYRFFAMIDPHPRLTGGTSQPESQQADRHGAEKPGFSGTGDLTISEAVRRDGSER